MTKYSFGFFLLMCGMAGTAFITGRDHITIELILSVCGFFVATAGFVQTLKA